MCQSAPNFAGRNTLLTAHKTAAFAARTAAGYFERVPAKLGLAVVEEACGKDALVELAGSKKAERCKRSETLMKGKGWLPKLMR